MRLKKMLFWVPVILLAIGCDVINPEEAVPTYVKIDAANLKINDPVKEGSAAHDISSVWVYYNNNPIGVFDLPATVPVITQGDEGVISIAPAISLNGFIDLQPVYPFYTYDTFTLKTDPGGFFTHNLTTYYFSATKFNYKEDFEVGNSFKEFFDGSTEDTSMVRTDQQGNVFEGGGSGYIYMDANNKVSENISNKGFDITQGESYVEINYKGSVSFEVGLYNTLASGVDAYKYFAGVKASPDVWKKIYIELGTYTSQNKGTNYKLLIKSALGEGESSGYVLFDNIKVVSF